MKCIKLVLSLACFYLLCATSFAAELIAKTDRSTIQLNETFQLTLSIHQAKDFRANPDWQKLEKDFYILNRMVSDQYTMINGQHDYVRHWVLTLQPKKPGKLTVPVLSIGSLTSKSIVLHVQMRTAHGAGNQHDVSQSVYVEAKSPDVNPYQGQRLAYTVKLYTRASIQEGMLSPPIMGDHVTIQPVGVDEKYNAQIHGDLYQVLIRRYLLTFNRPGAYLVKSAEFVGSILGKNKWLDPFGFVSMLNKPIHIASNTLHFTVKEKPASMSKKDWLPAMSFSAERHWQTKDIQSIKIGVPITLVYRLVILGQYADAIAPIMLPELSGVGMYPEKRQIKHRWVDNQIQTEINQQFVLIPKENVGQVTLPSVTFHWWDVTHDQARTTVLKALGFHVQGQPIVSPVAATTQQITAIKNHQTTWRDELVSLWGHQWFWPLCTLFMTFLWLMTVLGYKRFSKSMQRQNMRQSEPACLSTEQLMQQLKQVCMHHQAGSCAQLLCQLARCLWPNQVVVNLQQAIQLFHHDALAGEMVLLNKYLYSQRAIDQRWDGAVLWQALSAYMQHHKDHQSNRGGQKSNDDLPPFYPSAE